MKDQTLIFVADLFLNLQENSIEQHDFLAESTPPLIIEIKSFMDRTFGPPWHCVVGKGFGSAVTYVNRHFLFLYIANKAILIFKY
jgi:hypothetical protein